MCTDKKVKEGPKNICGHIFMLVLYSITDTVCTDPLLASEWQMACPSRCTQCAAGTVAECVPAFLPTRIKPVACAGI